MKLWGGRFEKPTDRLVEEFTSSLPIDTRLYEYDIKGSLAHVAMLSGCGIISSEEADTISQGLNKIYKEIKDGSFKFNVSDEDIHLAIERSLIERVGPVGGKLHTARSRNDQVALDMRMYLKETIKEIATLVVALQNTLLDLAKKHLDVILPGYTHLQRAQPILFSHHYLAYFFMLQRDFERLKGCHQRTDVMPLGTAAIAGTSFAVDRKMVADQLGFARISENSVDTTSDRDFVVEFLSTASILMVHLSRLAEEIVLWSSSEFGFIELDDAYTTGSSIMPQKKNPDVAELVRAKTARVMGNLIAMLATLKALPMSYNRDLQEDKNSLFSTVDVLVPSLLVFKGMLETIRLRKENMQEAAAQDFSTATDIADYLVSKGLPFRQAHEIVGRLVKDCLKDGNNSFNKLTLEEFKKASQLFDEDVFKIIVPLGSVENKVSEGGTSTESVKGQIKKANAYLKKSGDWLK